MAKFKKGILGPISGKLGPVIGTSWNGIPYLKMPAKGTPKKRLPSDAQLASQQKFKFTNALIESLQTYMDVGFHNFALGKTAANAAFSYHYHHVVTGEYPNLGLDYSRLMISKGNLKGLAGLGAEFLSADTIQLNWTTDYGPKRVSFDDQLILVLYSPEIAYADGFIGAATRKDNTCTYTFHPRLIGKALEVYVGLASVNRKKFSDSQYLGRILPL